MPSKKKRISYNSSNTPKTNLLHKIIRPEIQARISFLIHRITIQKEIYFNYMAFK